MSFARTGDPNNSAIPNWPACTPDHIYTLVTSKNTRVECNYDDDKLNSISKLYAEMSDKADFAYEGLELTI